jgi:CubicO group peptidase (beta-lactamase class C family)
MMNFEAFTKDITQNQWQVFGAEVYRRGQLLYRWGDCTTGLHPLYSVTKSVLSLAVGIAEGEGRIDLSRPVTGYLPAAALARMSEKQRQTFAPLTLHRLLTMSAAGFPMRPEGDSWLDFSLSCPLEAPEQPRFDYSNIPAYLVGVALTHALSEDAGSYIEKRLLQPLGIEKYRLARCPEGYFYGASGMELTVESLSRIGLMLLAGGVYGGQRIVPAGYVRRATSVQQMNREGGYGYFFWKYRSGFSMNGKWKQKSYILPDDGLVISYLADIREECPLRQSMEKHLLGAAE